MVTLFNLTVIAIKLDPTDQKRVNLFSWTIDLVVLDIFNVLSADH